MTEPRPILPTAKPLAFMAITALGLLGAVVAGARPGAAAAEGVPRSLVCEFTQGVASTIEGDEFQSKPGSALSFLITSIDLDRQSAEINTGPAGTLGKLRIVRALNANHFLEVLAEGFIGLTTVYEADGRGRHPAVHSRHSGLLGAPILAHYTGFCRPG